MLVIHDFSAADIRQGNHGSSLITGQQVSEVPLRSPVKLQYVQPSHHRLWKCVRMMQMFHKCGEIL